MANFTSLIDIPSLEKQDQMVAETGIHRGSAPMVTFDTDLVPAVLGLEPEHIGINFDALQGVASKLGTHVLRITEDTSETVNRIPKLAELDENPIHGTYEEPDPEADEFRALTKPMSDAKIIESVYVSSMFAHDGELFDEGTPVSIHPDSIETGVEIESLGECSDQSRLLSTQRVAKELNDTIKMHLHVQNMIMNPVTYQGRGNYFVTDLSTAYFAASAALGTYGEITDQMEDSLRATFYSFMAISGVVSSIPTARREFLARKNDLSPKHRVWSNNIGRRIGAYRAIKSNTFAAVID